MINAFMYTLGIVANLWFLLCLFNLYRLVNHPLVKYGAAPIKLNWHFPVSLIFTMFFWLWIFVG